MECRKGENYPRVAVATLMAHESEERRLLFAIMEHLDALRQQADAPFNKESLEVALNCLGEASGLDLRNEGHVRDLSSRRFFSLRQAFKEARFVAFARTLEESGYFKDAPEGSQQHRELFARAREKFHERYYSGDDDLKTAALFAAAADSAAKSEKAPDSGAAGAPPPGGRKPTAEERKRAEQLKEEGNRALQGEKYQIAVDIYTKALELDPENAALFGNRAAAYLTMKMPDRCVADCKRALAINPQYPKVWHRLGRAHQSLGQHDEAIKAFEKGRSYAGSDDALLAPLNKSLKESREALARPAAAQPPAPPLPAEVLSNVSAAELLSVANSPMFQEFLNSQQGQQVRESLMALGTRPDFVEAIQNLFSGGAGDAAAPAKPQ